MQEEIFGISLDDDGRRQIVRLHKKVRWIFIGSILWSLLNLLFELTRLNYIRQVMNNSKSNSLVIVIYSNLLLSVILIPLQSYFYYAFSKQMKLSTEEQNAGRFNQGFRLLNINATLVLLSIVFNFLNIVYTVLSVMHHWVWF